jgi:hypothetical protein
LERRWVLCAAELREQEYIMSPFRWRVFSHRNISFRQSLLSLLAVLLNYHHVILHTPSLSFTCSKCSAQHSCKGSCKFYSLPLACLANCHLQGLKYFGTATDNPELTDTAYLEVLSNISEFGQITIGNSQKVGSTGRREFTRHETD